MKILLLSAYNAPSHQRWIETLRGMFEDWHWTVLTLPPRHFNWRLRGNSLSWAFSERQLLQQHYDLVLATSMVDLSSLRGFVPRLGTIPTLVYFHENQFAYPGTDKQFQSIEPRVLNLYTALAADYVLFNSEFNRTSFLQGAAAMLDAFPDCVPSGVIAGLQQRTAVLPVPLQAECFRQCRRDRQQDGLRVLWNHRWEYDKGPGQLLEIVRQSAAAGLAIEWYIVGQQFRRSPAEFDQIRREIDTSRFQSLGHWGFVEQPAEYGQILDRADIVLSTALHDFQGLAVMEAVAAGCLPLLPQRLCYPDWFDERYCYASIIDNPAAEAAAAVRQLQAWADTTACGLPPLPDISELSSESLRQPYASVLQAVAAGWPSAQ